MVNNIALELKKILPELEGLRLKTKGKLSKEEGDALEKPTENILVKPLLNAFGYRTETITASNRAESEYKIGTKRVDFALIKDNKLVIVIEVKRLGTDISKHRQQLSDYFNTTDKLNIPSFGILTDGEVYNIYHSQDNRMDDLPCFSFHLLEDIDNEEKLSKLAEILMNVNEDVAKTERLYTNTKIFIEHMLEKPQEGLVKVLIKASDEFYNIKLSEGKSITSKDVENIQPLISIIYKDILRDNVNKTLDSAKQPYKQITKEDFDKKDNLEFNEYEREALYIIRAISSEIENFDVSRINEHDYKGHCDIVLDGKAIKNKICRLYFNNKNKLSI